MRKSIKGFIAIFIIVLGVYFLPTTTLAKINIPSATSDFYVNSSPVDSKTDLSSIYVICAVLFACIVVIIIAFILSLTDVKKKQKIDTSSNHLKTVTQNATEIKNLTVETINEIEILSEEIKRLESNYQALENEYQILKNEYQKLKDKYKDY